VNALRRLKEEEEKKRKKRKKKKKKERKKKTINVLCLSSILPSILGCYSAFKRKERKRKGKEEKEEEKEGRAFWLAVVALCSVWLPVCCTVVLPPPVCQDVDIT